MSAACTADGQHVHDATAPNRNAAVQYWYVVVVAEISCGTSENLPLLFEEVVLERYMVACKIRLV